MKANEKTCQRCLGLAKKTYYFNGLEYCEECYLKAIAENLTVIANFKEELASRADWLEKATGRAINFGLDNTAEIYVNKGLDLIAKALDRKIYTDENPLGGNRQGVRHNDTDFFMVDLGV